MAWTSVKEQSHLATSGANETGRTARRVFIAVSDEPTECVDAETANDGTTAIPTVLSGHPRDGSRRATSIDATPDPESRRKVFKVEVEYSTRTLTEFDNPLDELDRISWNGAEGSEAYFLDRSPEPKPVVNTAGQPYEDFRERDSSELTAVVRRNFATQPVATALAFKDRVNTDSFTLGGVTIGAGEAKCGAWTIGEMQERNGTDFCEVSIPIKFRASWDEEIPSYGYQDIDADGAGPWPIVDEAQQPIQRPWPLDENGRKKEVATDKPYVQTFAPYFKTAYAPLSLA